MYAIEGLVNIEVAEKKFFETHSRFGSIQELSISGELNGYGESLRDGSMGYRLDLLASGSILKADTTPKAYGWQNGYRSFSYMPGSGMRGADHRGAFATTSDPPGN